MEEKFTKQGLGFAIGNFDGVHKGHQYLIAKLKEICKERGIEAGIITFSYNTKLSPKLSTLEQKIAFLEALDIKKENIIVLDFEKYKNFEAEDFVKNILCEKMKVSYLVSGDDFRIGKDRKGDLQLLQNLAKKYGFGYEFFTKLKDDSFSYSSDLVRKFLAQGNIEMANKILTRPFSIKGEVLHGNKLGRTIGFPTINVGLDGYALPKLGVYSARVLWKGQVYDGAVNIGIRPTVNTLEKALLEMYIFNFATNIYGEIVEVMLYDFIREEKTFESLEILKENIANDCKIIKEKLKTKGKNGL